MFFVEWMITFDLCDHGLMLRTGEWKGITVRYFRKKIAELPIPHIGDVIMIRNIKVSSRGSLALFSSSDLDQRSIYNNTPMLMSSWNTQSMNFGEESVPNSDGTIENVDSRKTIHCVCIPVEKRPSQEDQVYAMELKNTFGQAVMSSIPPHLLIHNLAELQGFAHQYLSDHGSASGAPVTPGPQRQPSSPTTASSATSHSATAPTPWHKFALVQDVQVNKFHDLTVEVVKIFANKYGDSVDMYVTDYTSHKELYDYPSPEESAKEGGDGDAYGYIATRHEGFPGPWGQRVLLVEVRQPHMSYLMQSVKVGDFVDIRNVRIKISRAGRLEGNMWLDNKFPDKVGITKIKPGSNEESRGVVERRTAYWSAREQQPQQEKKMGKKERKKRKRAEDKARAAEDSKMSKLDAVVASSGYGESICDGLICDGLFTLSDPLTTVRTAHRDIPLTTLSSLLEKHGQWRWEGKDEELPFVNQRRRCQLQAIDYYPPRLRDFARPRVQTKADDFVGSDGDMDMDEQGWEWDFFLLVRDPIPRGAPTKSSAQTWLHVSNTAAQYLLKMDASE